MEYTFKQCIALNLDDLLKEKLLPCALATAGYAVEDGLESLQRLALPRFEGQSGTPAHYRRAAEMSRECTLFGVALLARELAETETAHQIADEILALIWDVLTDLAWAIEREGDYGGFFAEGAQAEANWEKWKQTNPAVQAVCDAFYQDLLIDYLFV